MYNEIPKSSEEESNKNQATKVVSEANNEEIKPIINSESKKASSSPTKEDSINAEEIQKIEQIVYKEEHGRYECILSLKDGYIKIHMKKSMEPEFWERTLNFAEATQENELWGSLLNVNLLHTFIVSAFKNSAVSIIVTSEIEITLEFQYQMGFTQIKLPLKIPKGKMTPEAILAEYGKIIKQLYDEREELKDLARTLREEIKALKGGNTINDKIILCQKSSGGQVSTYNSTFTDMPSVKEGELYMKHKGKAYWSLHMNGLWYNSAGGYIASFRIELTDTNSGVKKYWPNEKGCYYRVYSSCGGNLNFPFHYSDIANLEEGTYKVKLQWAYSANSSSYIMYYNPGYGDLKLIAILY